MVCSIGYKEALCIITKPESKKFQLTSLNI